MTAGFTVPRGPCGALSGVSVVCEVLRDDASGLGVGTGTEGLGAFSPSFPYFSAVESYTHPHTHTYTSHLTHIHTPTHTHHGTHTITVHTLQVFLKSACYLSLLFGSQTQAACLLPDWFVDLN